MRVHLPARSGLTLLEFVVTTVVCALLVAAVAWYGLATVVSTLIAGALFSCGVVVWGLCYVRAPESTRNASALLLMAFIVGALAPCWVLQSREQARRERAADSMRRIGLMWQAEQEARGPGRGERARVR